MSEPNVSSKLWSQICEEADPEMAKEDKTAYRFSNGRRFEAAGTYEPEA